MNHETERLLFAICGDSWRKTYKLGMSDAEAIAWQEKEHRRIFDAAGEVTSTPSEFGRHVATTKWIHCGAPRIVTNEKYAAAMMCTAVSEPLVDDIVIPWKSFRVELPHGLLGHGTYSYSHILVSSFDECALLILEGNRPANRPGDDPEDETVDVCQVKRTNDLGSLLLDREGADEYVADGTVRNPTAKDAKGRAIRMATRLVVGLLYTMQYTQHFKTAPRSLNDNRRGVRSGPPMHRTIFVGRPISTQVFDVRRAVRDYCDGHRGAPSVQSLVRGHFKRQVVGIARNGRKVIWVEPYWRGPEDAPILSRPYKVGT